MEEKSKDSVTDRIDAEVFQRAIHDCPYCGAELLDSPSHCPRCSQNSTDLDNLLGTEGPVLKQIMDFQDHLAGGSRKVKSAISKIEKKFPQLTLLYCSVNCPGDLKPSQLAWWMFNQGQHPGNSPWTGLLLLDAPNRQITFQSGYELETFIPRTELEFLLKECGEWFAVDEWAGGIANFFIELYPILVRAHQAARKTEKKARKQMPVS